MRLVDASQNVSLGFLFGRVLPSNSTKEVPEISKTSATKFDVPSGVGAAKRDPSFPLVLASVLVQDEEEKSLQAFNGAFPALAYSVTVKGKPVSHDPDMTSPPDFAVKFGNNGSFVVGANQTVIDVSVGNVKLLIRASDPVPWGPDGEGPEGWLIRLPLPLQWFVYSLRSRVTYYSFADSTSGKTITGKTAALHMEKNWGKAFPPAWIWSQGLAENNVTLALSGGIVDFEVLNVTAFLVGYRHPGRGLVLNFTPADSVASFLHDGCRGVVRLNLTGLEHKLEVNITAPLPSFSQCLLGPEREGFRPACVESYRAVASVRVYKRDLFEFVEIDRADIDHAALEFGGGYVCKKKCSGF